MPRAALHEPPWISSDCKESTSRAPGHATFCASHSADEPDEAPTDRKWGQAYLTRDFFQRLSAAMPERVLLVIAEDANGGERPIAGALNLIGSHALFGRNWGCEHRAMGIKHLHFEVCYYQVGACSDGWTISQVEALTQSSKATPLQNTPDFESHFAPLSHVVCFQG